MLERMLVTVVTAERGIRAARSELQHGGVIHLVCKAVGCAVAHLTSPPMCQRSSFTGWLKPAEALQLKV